tara:strand:- start:994 stop:1215 length:222 start_codon:yes stop_codon:yes gene_type:complete
MSLRHPFFHRTILALLLDVKESGYELPTIENREAFKNELLQELEEGIFPIIERCCYQNPSVKRNEEESNLPKC